MKKKEREREHSKFLRFQASFTGIMIQSIDCTAASTEPTHKSAHMHVCIYV
jgi:hypothetical protein